MNDSFANGASLSTVVANNEYPRVVIRHGQTSIILGLRRITQWYWLCVPKLRGRTRIVPRIDQHRRRILSQKFYESLFFYLHHPAQRSPHWSPQLVSAHVLISGLEQLIPKTLAPAAIETVAVQNQRLIFVGYRAQDRARIADVQSRRSARLSRDRPRSRNMANGVLVVRPGIEDNGAGLF